MDFKFGLAVGVGSTVGWTVLDGALFKRAASAFSIPDVETLPAKFCTLVTLFNILAFISSALNEGSLLFKRAATPVMNGVAIEVPLIIPYLLPGRVLRIFTPGAEISTFDP